MNNIREKKVNAFNEIFNAYEIYKGNYRSKLEIQIANLKNKLSEEEYANLYFAYEDYKNYFFKIMAMSQRDFIRFNENKNFDNIEQIFEDIKEGN